jgi:hypothetical protein
MPVILGGPPSKEKPTSDLPRIGFKQGGVKNAAHGSWYRGPNCNYIATKKNFEERDALQNYVLKGWLPQAPFISKSDTITTFGSCFADHVTTYLHERGYTVTRNLLGDSQSHVIRQGAGIVNVFALEQQFAWAYENRQFNEQLWHGSDGTLAKASEKIRKQTKEVFDVTSVFILTLGLSEVWCNKKTGNVFWRAIPATQFDPEVHGFRVATVEETKDKLENIFYIIKRYRPEAKVIFTLSPVPLVATFRPISCVTANEVSKSVLRVALDEWLRTESLLNKELFYWPSYEIVRYYAEDPYREDNRHIRKGVVAQIMEAFVKHFCCG